MEEIIVYTDGACSGNPGPGGWGAIIVHQGKQKELSGFVADTTNNRMELTAVIEGLSAIPDLPEITVKVFSDSKYVVDAFNAHWIEGWQRKNWRNSAKQPVANRDLWEKLIVLQQKLHPVFTWVRGHDESELNNRCDAIAVKAIKDNLGQN